MEVRLAARGDERGLAEVRVHGWQRGYDGLLDAAFLEAMSVDDDERRWSSILDAGDLRRRILVLDASPDVPSVVGFSSVGPYGHRAGPRHDQQSAVTWAEPGTVGEIYAFYIRPERWGSGIADTLMDVSVAELVADGWSEARLWVLGGNGRARRFYERHGWVPDGVQERMTIAGGAIEVRYTRSIPD